MKLTTLISLTLAGVLIAGCGSSFTSTGDNGSPLNGSLSSGLSGRVLGETGGGQAGVRLVVHERTSNYKGETISNSDGIFQLTLPPGVYDLGLDREGDSQTATSFYGPVTVTGQESQNFVLRASNGRPNGQIFGQLFLKSGVPAANRKVNLRSAHLPRNADGSMPAQSVSGTTGADGTFQLELSSDRELGVDIEAFDANGNFDEFIDIGKLSKPAYVKFQTETQSPANRLRSDESETTLAANQTSRPTDFAPYSQFFAPPPSWSNGLIPVSSYNYQMFDEIQTQEAADRVFDYLQVSDVSVPSGLLRVDRNGSWWWKYAVNVHTGDTGLYEFTDETGDTYRLTIFQQLVTYTHKVSYNSKMPIINQIEWSN